MPAKEIEDDHNAWSSINPTTPSKGARIIIQTNAFDAIMRSGEAGIDGCCDATAFIIYINI